MKQKETKFLPRIDPELKEKAEYWNPSNFTIEFIEGAFCGTNKGLSIPTDINHFYDSTGCAIEIIGNIHQQEDIKL